MAVADIFTLPTGGTEKSLLVRIPLLAGSKSPVGNSNMYNIAMVDVSASMSEVWPLVLESWNEHVALKLVGRTDIYTFGAQVKHRREGIYLHNSDNDCSSTNLTGALKTIRERISACIESHIRVYLITDGHHNYGSISPESEIELMKIPAGKTVEVFLLGVGDGFPVQYSVDIRSHLHNGAANCPTIFWSRENSAVNEEMMHIAQEMKKGLSKVNLSIPAKILPLVDDSKKTAYAGEFLYFETDSESLRKQLTITSAESGEVIPLSSTEREPSAMLLVDNVFKQWIASLIQRRRNKEPVPMAIFDLMKKLFQLLHSDKMSAPKEDSIKSRLSLKNQKHIEMQFSSLMNQSYKIISLENEFSSDIELAKAIIHTAVQSKYDSRLLQLRGYKEEDWKKDVAKFKELYLQLKDEIMALRAPDAEESCRILLCSFLGDLQDPDFLEILDQNKIEFLSNLSFTGIPVFAPIKDSAQINCWTQAVKNICNSPFEIISQRALESSVALNGMTMTSPDKEIIFQKDNPNSKCNIIVPIIPKEHCKLLKPLVRTNVFAVGATFCILKNPLIIDQDCHLAALACVWMKTIRDFPPANRPDYITNRIENVVATANLYLDRKYLQLYCEALLEEPKLALMTESNKEFKGNTLKCESLIKPTFLLHTLKEKLRNVPDAKQKFISLLKMILTEFLGRCLTTHNLPNPCMVHLLSKEVNADLNDWLLRLSTKALEKVNLSGQVLFKECYYPAEARQFASKSVKAAMDAVKESSEIVVCPNDDKLVRLRNSGSAGHVGWEDLKAWAFEMVDLTGHLVSKEDIDMIFSNEMVCSYIFHALHHRKSNERFVQDIMDPEASMKAIQKEISSEKEQFLQTNLLPKILDEVELKWQAEFDACHKALAVPLSKLEIIDRAQKLGIDVTEETFGSVYKYRPNVGLCRNCCQVEACPHFLRPNRKFNCHLEPERNKSEGYPHTLHLSVASNYSEPDKCLESISEGRLAGTNNRRKPSAFAGSDALRDTISELSSHYLSFKTQSVV